MAYLFYDEAGRARRIENRGSAWDTVINYFHHERNQNGLPTWIRREDGKNTYYTWDALDRLSVEQQLTGSTIDLSDYYTYDLHGSKTSKLSTVSGTQIDSFYDPRNIITKSQIVGGATIYLEYDAAQRLLSRKITDGSSSHYFQHDQLNNLTRIEILPALGGTDVFTLRYNAAGERVFKKDSNASSPAYLTWDGKSVLHQQTGGGTSVYRYRYTPVRGAPISRLSEFDPVGFATSKQLAAGDVSVRKLMQDAGTAFSYYNYDIFGKTTTFVTGSGLSQNYHLRFLPDTKYHSVTLGNIVTGSPGEILDEDAGTVADEDIQARARAGLAAHLNSGLGFNIGVVYPAWTWASEAAFGDDTLTGPEVAGWDENLNPIFISPDDITRAQQQIRVANDEAARQERLAFLDVFEPWMRDQIATNQANVKLQMLNVSWIRFSELAAERKMNNALGAVSIGTSVLPVPHSSLGGKALAFGVGATLGGVVTSYTVVNPDEHWYDPSTGEIDYAAVLASSGYRFAGGVTGGVRGLQGLQAPFLVTDGYRIVRSNALTVTQEIGVLRLGPGGGPLAGGQGLAAGGGFYQQSLKLFTLSEGPDVGRIIPILQQSGGRPLVLGVHPNDPLLPGMLGVSAEANISQAIGHGVTSGRYSGSIMATPVSAVVDGVPVFSTFSGPGGVLVTPRDAATILVNFGGAECNAGRLTFCGLGDAAVGRAGAIGAQVSAQTGKAFGVVAPESLYFIDLSGGVARIRLEPGTTWAYWVWGRPMLKKYWEEIIKLF